MSISITKKRPQDDSKPIDPIIGYMLVSVNHTPVIKRSVTASQKSDVSVELTQMVAQLWKLFGAAFSLTLEFCSENSADRDIIVYFTR